MVYQYHQDEKFDASAACKELMAEIWPAVKREYRASMTARPEEWNGLEGRLRECLPRLVTYYFDVYAGCVSAWPQFRELVLCIVRNWAERSEALKQSDAGRLADPDWFQSNQLLGAVCYVDRFAGDLKKLKEKIPFFKEEGITYLHLMPLFKTLKGENDGGYAVSSYREVDPRLGTVEDLEELAAELHRNGIVLVLDFVFNHTSDEHAWAMKAKAGDEKYRNYYWMFDDRAKPDQYERTLREIFPEEHPGAFTWFPDIHKWVWTTFHSFQWDLNYQNPQVLVSMADEMLHLCNLGVDILRLDAVAFIWKQLGTSCESLPQAYTLIEIFNLIGRIASPPLLFKSEAIVHPDEVIRYISPESCRLSYNPLLMALMWESLATRETKLLTFSMRRRFNLPPHTAWVNYIRCHDDIGWTFSDEDAAQLSINAYPHRAFLNRFYTGRFPGSFARGLPFQENKATGDCRISGMLASLAGLEKSLAEQDGKETGYSLDRITLLFGITMLIGGIPLIYLGDEIGMLNDYSYQNDPQRCKDSRWVHRTVYDWQAWEQRKDPRSIPGRLWGQISRLISIRKGNSIFAEQKIEVPEQIDPHIFCFIKRQHAQTALVIANFSEHEIELPASVQDCFRSADIRDLYSGEAIERQPMRCRPYQLMVLYGK